MLRHAKKPTVENLRVLDVYALTERQRAQLASTYDVVCTEELSPLSDIANDSVRESIDGALSRVLDLSPLTSVRRLLSEEPVVCGKPIASEVAPEKFAESLQLELI